MVTFVHWTSLAFSWTFHWYAMDPPMLLHTVHLQAQLSIPYSFAKDTKAFLNQFILDFDFFVIALLPFVFHFCTNSKSLFFWGRIQISPDLDLTLDLCLGDLPHVLCNLGSLAVWLLGTPLQECLTTVFLTIFCVFLC